MIVSASRRTDIPAFYAPWFMNRIRAGSCRVPNPFNRRQVSEVPLRPDRVAAIAFWTRDARPLLPHLAELDERGFAYYFLYTLLDNPRAIDRASPPAEVAAATMHALADRLGPDRVVWRYDPVVLTEDQGPDEHLARFTRLAASLRGATRRCVVSVMDRYPKIGRRLGELAEQGMAVADEPAQVPGFARLMTGMAAAADANGMSIQSCAEELDLAPFGIRPGACIDGEHLAAVFGLDRDRAKDPSQRQACGCVQSRDIGMYDTCLFGCAYCYATTSRERAALNHARHDPEGEALLP